MNPGLFDDHIYWIWLADRLGTHSLAMPALLGLPGGARRLYDATPAEIKHDPGFPEFSDSQIHKLSDKDLSRPREFLALTQASGGWVLTPSDPEYPDSLRRLAAPPAALYMQGRFADMAGSPHVAIVGSRKVTELGYRSACELARQLAEAGVCVVSGGAQGVDTAAHTGAAEGGGNTIMVLGCGLDYPYNAKNAGLRLMIKNRGALMSEYPPGSPPLGWHFPHRNRLIAALSHAVVVGQAGLQSGALITAGLALEQGLPVYVLDQPESMPLSAGSLQVIEDGGTPITRVDQLLAPLANQFSIRLPDDPPPLLSHQEGAPHSPLRVADAGFTKENNDTVRSIAPEKSKASSRKEPDLSDLSDGSLRIWGIIKAMPPGGFSLADLEQAADLPPSELLSALTELEIAGAIDSLPGKRFVVK